MSMSLAKKSLQFLEGDDAVKNDKLRKNKLKQRKQQKIVESKTSNIDIKVSRLLALSSSKLDDKITRKVCLYFISLTNSIKNQLHCSY